MTGTRGTQGWLEAAGICIAHATWPSNIQTLMTLSPAQACCCVTPFTRTMPFRWAYFPRVRRPWYAFLSRPSSLSSVSSGIQKSRNELSGHRYAIRGFASRRSHGRHARLCALDHAPLPIPAGALLPQPNPPRSAATLPTAKCASGAATISSHSRPWRDWTVSESNFGSNSRRLGLPRRRCPAVDHRAGTRQWRRRPAVAAAIAVVGGGAAARTRLRQPRE